MSQQWDKILLYKDRSVSQCIETTFDFMRQNRRAWFSSALTLLLPWSLLLGLSAFTPSDDEIGTEGLFFEMSFKWKGDSAPFFFPVLFIGVWMAYVHVYALLTTYDERGEAINRLTQRQFWPSYWRMALRSSWLAVLFFLTAVAIFLSPAILSLLLVVVMIPLSLLPSVSLFERAGVFKAVGKSLRLGFNAWFQLFFTIALMVLFGFFMTMVIELPSSLFDLAFGALYGSGRSLGAVAVLFQYSFTALLYLGFFIVISMTLMAVAYQYGTVSERIDIASLEGDIRNFENL